MRIGSWKKLEDKRSSLEAWINPVNKMVVSISYSDLTQSYNIFIYPYRTKPPATGKNIITFHKHGFKTLDQARGYATSIMRKNPENMFYFKKVQLNWNKMKINFIEKMLYDFFKNKAMFAPHGKHKWYREGLVIEARPIIKKPLGSIKIEIKSDKTKEIVQYGFLDQETSMKKLLSEKKYWLQRIDEAAKKVWVFHIGLKALGEVLEEINPKEKPTEIYIIGPEYPNRIHFPPYKEQKRLEKK